MNIANMLPPCSSHRARVATNKCEALCTAELCTTWVPPGGGVLVCDGRGGLTYCTDDDPVLGARRLTVDPRFGRTSRWSRSCARGWARKRRIGRLYWTRTAGKRKPGVTAASNWLSLLSS
ncbi:hypothetical protein SALCHL_005995 [Streptomyces albus subsp. chlorinus]|uniref:hypothetical protein n=1 Tax=Streptomyces albus TaxID=1888 RepID=UPI003D11D9C0